MHLTKNRIHRLIFYTLISFLIIFNGGNYDIYPQFNFICIGSFFLYCFADLNYRAHIKKIFFHNKNNINLSHISIVFNIANITISTRTYKIFITLKI